MSGLSVRFEPNSQSLSPITTDFTHRFRAKVDGRTVICATAGGRDLRGQVSGA